MPVIPSQKQTYPDTLLSLLYGDVVLPQTEWSNIAGLGAPESNADVTGDHTLLQNSPPDTSIAKEGDLWFDLNDTNKPYKLVAGVWTSIRDTGVASGPDIGQWTNNLVFSATDYRVVAWGSGTIKLKDGTTYSITASNTGNMSAVTYIYLDTAVSSTALQTTTTSTTAVGSNKLLVAVAKQNSDTAKDAEFQVFGGYGQSTFITADNIAANTITGNEIAANTITANKMSVSTLSAIAADLGTITAGNITLASGGFVRSGQTAYDTGTGWYLGNDSGTSKFSIGDGSTNYARWNGSTWETSGKQISQDSFTTGIAIDAGSAVALESDGLLYRTRATDFSTKNTESTLSTAVTAPYSYKSRLLSVSSTMKALFYIPISTAGTNTFLLKQIAVSPTSSSITSVTSTDINTTGNSDTGADAVMVTSSDAVACWIQGSTGVLRARYVSAIDSTVSLGTVLSVVTATNGAPPSIAKVSATETLMIYRDSNADVIAISVTSSGTNLTAGSTFTVASHASNQYVPLYVEQFPGTSTYCCFYLDTTNSKGYCVAFTYSGGVLTPGTPLEVTLTGFSSSTVGVLCAMSASKMAVFTNSGNGAGGELYSIQTMTLSGTTLTLQVQTDVENIGGSTATAGFYVSMNQISDYTFAIGYSDSTTSTVGRLYNLATNTLTAVGNELTHTGISASTTLTPTFIYHSPTRALMVGTSSTTTPGFAKTVDYSTNFSGTIGVSTSAAALSASCRTILGGENTSVSGLVVGTEYYADLDGGLTTAALGGTKRIGVAGVTTAKIIVQV